MYLIEGQAHYTYPEVAERVHLTVARVRQVVIELRRPYIIPELRFTPKDQRGSVWRVCFSEEDIAKIQRYLVMRAAKPDTQVIPGEHRRYREKTWRRHSPEGSATLGYSPEGGCSMAGP